MSTTLLFTIAGVVLFFGAAIQGTVGLGMNLIAAPLLALLSPAFVPVPLLFAALVLSALTVWRELPHVHWQGALPAVIGRVPGVVVGVFLVAALPPREFTVAVGVLVLGCILLSLLSWRPRPAPRSLLVAGFAGGVMGTSSSIGGPPVALLYQHEDGPTVRATLAAYMSVGSLLSLSALGVGGQIGSTQLWASAVLLPFMAAGFAVSGPLRRFLDAGWTRPCVLALAGGSAIMLIVLG
ncbi:TSUP family transporter [Parasphingorhabdus pacifica]